MWCFCVGKWVGKTPLLILQKRWLSYFSVELSVGLRCLFTMRHNVLGLKEVRVLKALNFLYRKPELNVLNFIATL